MPFAAISMACWFCLSTVVMDNNSFHSPSFHIACIFMCSFSSVASSKQQRILIPYLFFFPSKFWFSRRLSFSFSLSSFRLCPDCPQLSWPGYFMTVYSTTAGPSTIRPRTAGGYFTFFTVVYICMHPEVLRIFFPQRRDI